MRLTSCPLCLGTGQVNVLVSGPKAPQKTFQMNCQLCRGTGQVSLATARDWRHTSNQWCHCTNVDYEHEVIFIPDDPSRKTLRRSYYRHTVCGKILTIG